MRVKRWQIVSDDSVWMFPADITVSTVELPHIILPGDTELYTEYFESCIFYINGDSEVVKRYKTQDEAIAGHIELEKKYGLKRVNQIRLGKQNASSIFSK